MSEDLANPFRKDQPAPRRPELSGRDWARIYVMGGVLFLVVGTMLYMKKMTDALARAKERPGPGQVDYVMRDRPAEGAQDAPGPGEIPDGEKKVVQVPAPQGEEGLSFRELAAPFQDGEGKIVKETQEFITLVSAFLNSVTREGLAKKVRPELTADQAYRDPAAHRGEVLRVYGRLIQIYTERIDATTPDNVEFVYHGIMQEYLTNRTVCFYMPERPLDPATGKPVAFNTDRKQSGEFITDWVEVEGIFLRQYDYPSQNVDAKGQTVHARAAALFVKTLRIANKPEFSDPRGPFVFIVGGLGVLIAAIVVVAGVMARKYGAGTMRAKMREVRRQKGEGAPAVPSKPEPGDAAPKVEAPPAGGGADPGTPPPGEPPPAPPPAG